MEEKFKKLVGSKVGEINKIADLHYVNGFIDALWFNDKISFAERGVFKRIAYTEYMKKEVW